MLVERKPDENDQRLTRLTLTDAGREMARAMRTAQAGYVSETIGALPEDDRRELGRLLDALAGNIGEALRRFGDSPGAWYHPHCVEEDGQR